MSKNGTDHSRALRGSPVKNNTWFFSHPSGGLCACEYGTHQQGDGIAAYAERQTDCNLARARVWLGWLRAAATRSTFEAPWLTGAEHAVGFDGAKRRSDAFYHCIMTKRYDGIVLCGGRVSPWMACERDLILSIGGKVIDLTLEGPWPPNSLHHVTRNLLGIA